MAWPAWPASGFGAGHWPTSLPFEFIWREEESTNSRLLDSQLKQSHGGCERIQGRGAQRLQSATVFVPASRYREKNLRRDVLPPQDARGAITVLKGGHLCAVNY